MAPKPSSDPVDMLWSKAAELSENLGTTLAEINEMWAEIASMFEIPLYREGMPRPVIAEFLVDSAQHLDFMQRALALLEVRTEINTRNQAMNFPGKLAKLHQSEAPLDPAFIADLFDPDMVAAYRAFLKTLNDYPRDLIRLQAGALVAVFAPVYMIHDAFDAYLGRQSTGAEIYQLLLKLLQNAGLDELAKRIPFFNTIKEIAKAGHEHDDGPLERFQAGLDQQVRNSNLETAVEEGLKALDTTRQVLSEWRTAEDELNRKCARAINRCIAIHNFLAEQEP